MAEHHTDNWPDSHVRAQRFQRRKKRRIKRKKGDQVREDEEKEENKQGHERRDRESLHLQRTLEAQATRCHVNTRQIVCKHQARVKRNLSCFFSLC